MPLKDHEIQDQHTQPAAERAKQFLKEHSNEWYNLSELADHIDSSPQNIRRVLKQKLIPSGNVEVKRVPDKNNAIYTTWNTEDDHP